VGHTKREVGEAGKGTTKCGSRVAGIVQWKLVLISDITRHNLNDDSDWGFLHHSGSGVCCLHFRRMCCLHLHGLNDGEGVIVQVISAGSTFI
jgi:hypothetical protein